MRNKIGIGLLGHSFMGKAHTNAYKKIGYIFPSFPVDVELNSICGRNEIKVQEACARFGFKKWTTDWHDLLDDQEIQVFDNAANDDAHFEPSIAALRAGKHVIVEKPMAMTLAEAEEMYKVAKEAEIKGIKHMVGFNYRFVPALRLAKRIIDEGKLGEIYHFRSYFMMDRISDPTSPFLQYLKSDNPTTSVLGRLNSHPIDMLRFLLGTEVASVMAWSPSISLRGDGENESAKNIETNSMLWIKTAIGTVATFEASVAATGYKTMWQIEIHGSKGSLGFDLSRGNELRYFDSSDPLYLQGIKKIHVTEPECHDYIKNWWPKGHNLGWEHYHIHMLEHFLRSIHEKTDVAPWGATFKDGLYCQQVIDAALQSNISGGWVGINR